MRHISAQALQKRSWSAPEVTNQIVTAPTGGWNAIDPLAAMDPKYAPILQNWVPRTGFVEFRPGYSAWAQAITTGPIESLLVYRPAASTERMFAAGSGSIFEVTTVGATTTQQTSLSSNRWQSINFTPAGGSHYLYLVNGQDAARHFDGATWVQPIITGGPTTQNFNNISVWKRRIWFVQNNSTIAWYLATDAISGALAGSLDIGPLITRGGTLLTTSTLTMDGGNGPDDFLVLVSSRGEVILYKGTDPTNANAFALVGVFQLPPPLGERSVMDIGSDLAMITLQGVIPLSQALPVDSDAVRGVALTNKIQNAMLQSAAMAQNNFGWELSHFPAQGMIFLNVPLQANAQQNQYVMNALTGAWWECVGWNANTFVIFNDQLYFGDNNGNVNLAWSGPADLNTPIVGDMQCAFNYFGDPGRVKRMTMIQPLIASGGAITPTLAVDVDFGNVSPTAPVTTLAPTGAQYDLSLYDVGVYSAGSSIQALWQSVTAVGHALAVRMKVNLLPSGVGGTSVFDVGVFDTMVFDGFGTNPNTLQVNAFNAMVEYGGYV